MIAHTSHGEVVWGGPTTSRAPLDFRSIHGRSRGAANRRPLGRLAAALALAAVAACSAGQSGGEGDGLFAQTGGGGGGGGTGGRVVAMLEVEAGDRPSFILRGTVPVPKGTYPRADGLLPFSIRNWDGQVVPSQVEVVARYPVDSDGADVVEVLGRVDLPPGTAPGQRLRYEVVEDPHPRTPLPVTGRVLDLVSRGGVKLRARDVFGHTYELDLFDGVRRKVATGEATVLRRGQAAVQVRTYGTMMPTTSQIGPPNGALPHLFGAHAYLTVWAGEETISLDIRVNNGPSGRDHNDPVDNPMGTVYFESLDLCLPSGWTMGAHIEDPAMAPPQPAGNSTVCTLVRPNADGSLHVMPSQGQFHRRLAIAPVGYEHEAQVIARDEGLGFVVRGPSPDGGELYSWWNPLTARYFPQRHRLPELDHVGVGPIRGQLNWELNRLETHLESGQSSQYPFNFPRLGWAHPRGVQYGGMTGGTEIVMYEGVKTAEAASRAGYRAAQLVHRMYTDRQPVALYNKDGEPTRLSQWLIHGPQFDYVNMLFYLRLLPQGPDPFGYNQAPQFQVNYVRNTGLDPSYENALLNFAPIDYEHHIRYTRSPKVLAWLGNDAIAKDDLRLAGELFRLTYHAHPNSSSGNAITTGLLRAMNRVNAHPGVGFPFGRGESWGIDGSCAAFSLSEPDWRAEMRAWFAQIADNVARGQADCSGFIQARVYNKLLGGRYRARQSIEQAITENMLVDLMESVFRDADPMRYQQTAYVLEHSTYAMIGPMAWSVTHQAPWSKLAVGPLDMSQPPFCGSVPPDGTDNGPDRYQVWSSFAYGWEQTADQQFFNRAADMLGGGNLLNLLMAEGLNNIENRAALLAALQ